MAGEDGCARRPAAGCVVKLGEAQSVVREPIQVGRLNLATVTTDVGKTHVIRHDDQEVGPLPGPLVHQQAAGGRCRGGGESWQGEVTDDDNEE